ncbi:hypothetical protein [Caulobacter rhizosphaerae]|uniref:hypothetical protein n=1 Tax=Caulobacter rhizosphaerae TaxID=2010972 RepID=UPI0013D06340|nr:hypothetical protein [Caulobacter rhizosphaerae]GGL48187.1 hypothetical protein GCM10010983_51930 [Caulobacter rhizosphaerae]
MTEFAIHPPPPEMVAEVLISTLDAFTRAELAAERTPCKTTFLAATRAESVLFDVCLQVGMPFDEPSIVEWASAQACGFLVAA